MPRNKRSSWTDRAEDSTVSLAQRLFLAHLSEQGFSFPTVVLSLPTESLLALTYQQRKAPLSLWFCVSLALWSALLCFRVLLLSRVQLLIYQTGTTMSVSQTAQAGRAFPRQPLHNPHRALLLPGYKGLACSSTENITWGFDSTDLGPCNSTGASSMGICVWIPSLLPTEFLWVAEAHRVHILRHEMALWASSVVSQALNCILSHSSPIPSQMWWSCIPLTSPSTGKPHWLWLLSQFSLICASVVSPGGLQLPVFLVRQGMLAAYFCWALLPEMRVLVLLVGTTSSLVQRSTTSLLWCRPTTPLHLKKYLILNFLPNQIISYRMWNDYGEQTNLSGQQEWWDGMKSCPPCTEPPTPPRQCIWRWSLSATFPVGIIERPKENTDHDPMATTLPSHSALAQTLLGFLLCTLYPCSSCTGSVSSCLCILLPYPPLWAVVSGCLSFPASRRW